MTIAEIAKSHKWQTFHRRAFPELKYCFNESGILPSSSWTDAFLVADDWEFLQVPRSFSEAMQMLNANSSLWAWRPAWVDEEKRGPKLFVCCGTILQRSSNGGQEDLRLSLNDILALDWIISEWPA